MLLTFSKQTPWGTPTGFREKILSGEKVTTWRLGHRWKTGKRIHFWSGTPRNPKGNPEPIKANPNAPFCDGYTIGEDYQPIALLTYLQNFRLTYSNPTPGFTFLDMEIGLPLMENRNLPATQIAPIIYDVDPFAEGWRCSFPIQREGSIYHDQLLERIAQNDGFANTADFIRWLAVLGKKRMPKQTSESESPQLILEGQILRWSGQPNCPGYAEYLSLTNRDRKLIYFDSEMKRHFMGWLERNNFVSPFSLFG